MVKNNETWIGHGHSQLTAVAGMFCGMIDEKDERGPMLGHLKLIEAQVMSSQLKSILKGEKLVINSRGGYFPIHVGGEFTIKSCTGGRYTEDNIKINKWWGGKHYYAKIAAVDVVDEHGNVKWNTKKHAMDVAKAYMIKLNEE
jgi:hypothetical protein